MFLRLSINIIGFCLILSSCSKKDKQLQLRFDLNNDYTAFTETMQEKDTLSLFFNKSICEFKGYDIIEITKLHDSIFLEIKERSIMDEKQEQVFSKIQYNPTKEQPKLEELFCSLYSQNTLNSAVNLEHKLPQLILNHKNSGKRIALYSNGLAHNGRIIAFYDAIMSNLYPKQLPLKIFRIVNSE